MCGIGGVIGTADPILGKAMAQRMAHRGPDGEGVLALDSVAGHPPVTLVHRRLSVIDPTDRGAQPMRRGDGRYTITFNGEIYNYKELRRELERDGETFVSDSDTEVLLALYARVGGPATLDRVNGMFAFAIWDAERAELFLARDRLGIKPLYFAQRDGRFVFASEIKAMLPALPPPRLRTSAILDYLTFLYVPGPDSLFEGISKLPPGHHAVLRDGQVRVRQYWDVHFAPDGRGIDAWAPEVRESLQQAVRRQMVADVPLGAFLSGGIDSSAVVAEMSATGRRVSTYTVGFSAEDLTHDIVPDDLRYARKVGQAFDVDYHEQELRPDVVELLPKLVWHMDEPIGDPACISTFLICRAAREKLTVMLSGMGGDEVFAGYPRHVAALYGRLLGVAPTWSRRAVAGLVERQMTLGPPGRMRGPRRAAMKFARGIALSDNERYLTYSSYYREAELAALAPELRSAHSNDPFRYHREHFDHVRDENWLNQLLYVDMKTFLPGLNLSYTDKMSMAASTEVRVPLLDDEMVELAARIPPGLKLRRTTRKHVLKRSMAGVLSDEIINRRKAGFGAPVRAWLAGDLRPLVDDMLSPRRVSDRGLFDPAEVTRLIRANDTGREDNALRIWALLTFELWQQRFLDG